MECRTCKTEKSEEAFDFKDKKKGIRRATCKTCRRTKDAKYYQSNKTRREAVKTSKQQRRELAQKFITRVKQRSCCSNCGEDRWYTLDFHHLGDKSYTVSHMPRRGISLDSIKKEIRKCIIVCKNCHAEIHHNE